MEEAEAAADWYRRRSIRAAHRFLDEIDIAVTEISEGPLRCPVHLFGTRRKLLRHFPFLVVFRETKGVVQIIAFAHCRRRPGYWRDRLGE
jgi:plasmid stabilization system protein ParE